MGDNFIKMSVILYTSVPVESHEVNIIINQKTVSAKFTDSSILIDTTLNFGIHQLTIENLTTKRFGITQAIVGNCNLRKLFYLAWMTTTNNERVQPCNELWEAGQRWNLPFGYPVSNWISVVEQKFPNGVIGNDLYKDYWIWYPKSIDLDRNSPQIMKDFFEYNFNFTVVNKKNFTYDQIPYITYTEPVDQSLINQSYQELKNNQPLVNLLAKVPGQKKANAEEFGYADNQQWQSLLLYRKESPGLAAVDHLDRFPACNKLINSLNMPFWYVFIGIMPPGAIVYPHVDDMAVVDPEYIHWRGCTQLYIPIYQPVDSYLKIADAGTIDTTSGNMIINSDIFTHAAANNSTEYRYMLALRTRQDQISTFPITC